MENKGCDISILFTLWVVPTLSLSKAQNKERERGKIKQQWYLNTTTFLISLINSNVLRNQIKLANSYHLFAFIYCINKFS